MIRGYSAIGLCQPKDSINVGSALRAAYAYGAAMVATTGKRYRFAKTDTCAAHRHMPLLQVEDVFDAIPYDCVPVAIEVVENSISLPRYIHPRSAFYIFGPEDGSIPKSVLERCRDIVSVPTRVCMNLAATVNVVLYDRLAKSREHRLAEVA